MWEKIKNKNHRVDKMVSVTLSSVTFFFFFFLHYCTEISYQTFFSFYVFS